MGRPKILVQLDPDAHPSLFDAVVAVDADVDHLLQYRGVQPTDVPGLVHGAMFTRGVDDLQYTAIFVGGSDVTAGEALTAEVTRTFFGPMRVSVLFDASGANTTAAAAVLSAARHLELQDAEATVVAGTGPVGQRVARLLARSGARVRLTSRDPRRAEQACQRISQATGGGQFTPLGIASEQQMAEALAGSQLLIAAGAAGRQLVARRLWSDAPTLRVAIDLNAVPPAGIEGIEPTDRRRPVDHVTCYGAVGVGGLKMKIHKAAIARLFASNDQVLDAEEVFEIGRALR